MTFTEIAVEQGSPEWLAARLGCLTSTCADALLGEGRSGGEAAGRRNLRIDKVLERLTGQPQGNGFVSADMQRGTDLQPEAIGAYELRTGHLVGRSGFLRADGLMAGTSLDGHLDAFRRLVEVKCPKSANHWQAVRTGQIPTEYLRQITHHLWIVEAAVACDFVSYDPRFPAHLELAIIPVRRSDVDLVSYDRKARAFLAEVETEYQACLGWKAVSDVTV